MIESKYYKTPMIMTIFNRKYLPGRVVRKPVKAKPGLKVKESINFSLIKMFVTSYVLRSSRQN